MLKGRTRGLSPEVSRKEKQQPHPCLGHQGTLCLQGPLGHPGSGLLALHPESPHNLSKVYLTRKLSASHSPRNLWVSVLESLLSLSAGLPTSPGSMPGCLVLGGTSSVLLGLSHSATALWVFFFSDREHAFPLGSGYGWSVRVSQYCSPFPICDS